MTCVIGTYNRTDESTLSGGSWVATLPITNLQTKIIGQVARSTSAALVNSTFNVDCGSERKIQVASLVNHNISTAGNYRIRASAEAAATNLLLRSEDFSNAAWTKGGSSCAVSLILSPNGITYAEKVTENSATSPHGVFRLTSKAASPITYSYSMFVKAAERTSLELLLEGQLTGNAIAIFDLSTGLITSTTQSGGFTSATSTIESFDNGWCRVSVSATSNSDAGIYCTMYIRNGGVDNYLGDGASGVYIWGAQLETGTNTTSYYPTTTVAATRPAGYMDAWQSYLYDSGELAVWPSVYTTDQLEWEDISWWSGQYTEEEIEGYTPTTVHILTELVLARYWRVDILDSTNAAGYIQIGRLFIGSAWTPERDPEVGLSMAWETNSQVQKALSGTRYYQRRNPYRVTRFTLNVMEVDEAMGYAFEIDRRIGIDGEVLWIQDSEDTLHALRRRYLANMRELTPIEFPYASYTKKAYTLEEVV